MVELTDAQIAWVAPVFATVIPLLVSLVAAKVANPRLKAFLNQFFTLALAAGATMAAQDWKFDWQNVLVTFIAAYLTSEVMHTYVWKRYGLSEVIAEHFPSGVKHLPLTKKFAPVVEPAPEVPAFVAPVVKADPVPPVDPPDEHP